MKENNRQTFKQYLAEVDSGDLQLSQQADSRRAAGEEDRANRNAFKDKMTSGTPGKGDVVLIKANRFVVLGGSMDGLVVKQLGGDQTTKIPHGTKFQSVGQSNSGKNVFKVVAQ